MKAHTPNAFAICMKAHTPKAFASFSPGLLQPWELVAPRSVTLKALAKASLRVANAFSVLFLWFAIPGLKQTWAEISKRLRRKNLNLTRS